MFQQQYCTHTILYFGIKHRTMLHHYYVDTYVMVAHQKVQTAAILHSGDCRRYFKMHTFFTFFIASVDWFVTNLILHRLIKALKLCASFILLFLESERIIASECLLLYVILGRSMVSDSSWSLSGASTSTLDGKLTRILTVLLLVSLKKLTFTEILLSMVGCTIRIAPRQACAWMPPELQSSGSKNLGDNF